MKKNNVGRRKRDKENGVEERLVPRMKKIEKDES